MHSYHLGGNTYYNDWKKGADIFVRIRGLISTARKQGWSIFELIQQVVLYQH
jgi:hypothetical protein